ncbi:MULTISPECIES: hypothetical protein [Thioclava]|uniref:Uncharacterized protein n=1 Tax=Thioclava nitratireducens TaxID=1915078 RepID=A0ABN4X554_9RHOB|nr:MULTISPECIES: hypothetical protein [Thioclava]AQS47135.1 hypothetical protein BMG03_04485 [Thioclava nitratireducens]PWE48150.1 hypothetical protein DEM26_19790 [Thioclava sp. NG1]WGT51525.1 hypothetical protein P0N61_05715 [Thioclava nitratireducens]
MPVGYIFIGSLVGHVCLVLTLLRGGSIWLSLLVDVVAGLVAVLLLLVTQSARRWWQDRRRRARRAKTACRDGQTMH